MFHIHNVTKTTVSGFWGSFVVVYTAAQNQDTIITPSITKLGASDSVANSFHHLMIRRWKFRYEIAKKITKKSRQIKPS